MVSVDCGVLSGKMVRLGGRGLRLDGDVGWCRPALRRLPEPLGDLWDGSDGVTDSERAEGV
jgi:hypothetical protein